MMSRNFEMRTPRFPPGTCDLVFLRHRDVSPPGAHLFSTKCSKTPVPSQAMLSRDCAGSVVYTTTLVQDFVYLRSCQQKFAALYGILLSPLIYVFSGRTKLV
jgi:hypothetical protein